MSARPTASASSAAIAHSAAAARPSARPKPTVVEPTADAAWERYVEECAAAGVRDLAGIDLAAVEPYKTLNQYQRDLLSRTISTAPYRLYRSAVELVEKNICVSCWLLKNCCMCASMREFRCRHQVFLLMHHKEFGRGSNTGKLAVRAAHATDASAAAASHSTSSILDAAHLTASSALIQTEIPLQEQALLDLCRREPLNTVVLFPGKDSISMEELCALRGWRLPDEQEGSAASPAAPATAASDIAPSSSSSSSSSAPSAPSASSLLPVCPPLNIILLDGTWRQARSMKYLLPKEIPAIRIDPFKYKLDGTLRSLEEQARDVKDESEAPELASALASDNVEASSSSPSVAATTGAGSTPSTASKSSSKKLSQRDPAHLDGKVAASPTFVSLFYPLRKQSQPDRISTVEALVILLKELREPDQVTHRLLDLLRRLVDSMRVQSGMNSVYGTYTKAEAKQMRIDVTKKPPPSIESIAAASASTAAASGVQLPLTVVTAKGLVVQTSAALSADGSSLVRVTRKERAQRATAMRPCLQWNRHQPKCAADPCRFAHMCMLCNGQHRAVECKINQPTAGVVQAAVHQHGGELLPLNGAAAASSSSSSSDGFLASALPPPPPQPPAVPSPAVDSDLSASASSANMSISEQVVDTWRCQSRSRRRAPRHMVAMMSLFLAAVLCLASGPPLAECASSASVSPFPPGAFFTGSSFRSDLSHLDTLLALNGTHARLYGHFGYIIRELTGIDFNLTVERVQANFEAHQADFEAQADWSTMDLYIGTFMNATASGHMQPIIELGEGTVDALPKFNRTTERHRKAEEEGIAVEDEKREASESLHPFQQLIHRVYPSFPLELLASTDDGVLHRASNPLSAVGDMVPFDPNLVGVDCYLAYLYLYTRCFLRHYSASPFEYTFTYFQLENELNEAYLAGAGGQRYFQLFGSAWESADFQYELLSTLKSAVLAEQPNAVVTTNLHTDVPEAIHQLIGVPGYYADALQAWVGLLDWYAFDSYPNMFCAVPLEATARLSAILRTMRSIVPEDAFIVVMETGFGSLAHGVIATNDSAQWTEENQSLYAQQAFEAVQANGAQGFLWFSVAQSAGMQLTFEPDDYQMLTLLGDLLHSDASSSSILALVEWSLSNLGYVTGQFGRIVGQVDRAWGTNRADGSARPVVETLQQLYQSTARASRCDDAAGSGA